MPTLSRRQHEILALVADGFSSRDAGKRLFVSEDTIKTHLRRVYRVLGARDRAQAVSIAYRMGLLGGDQPQDSYRLGRAREAIARYRDIRDRAPESSAFARLYDELAFALAGEVAVKVAS